MLEIKPSVSCWEAIMYLGPDVFAFIFGVRIHARIHISWHACGGQFAEVGSLAMWVPGMKLNSNSGIIY